MKEIERIEDELFGSFDPEDESWIVGGNKTVTSYITYSPCCVDAMVDFDYAEAETQSPDNIA